MSRRWLLAITVLAAIALASKTWEIWEHAKVLSKHERLTQTLWPNGFKPFVPVSAIAFTSPPDGSLGEHVCTAQGCGGWSIDSDWTCRIDGGKWDAEKWECSR